MNELLSLKGLRCKYEDSGQMYMADGSLLVKHGNTVRSKSGYSATAELERAWVSGLSGHTHRAGQVYRRNSGGAYTWAECGCLCDLAPEYAEGQIMDWCHAVGYGEIEKGGNRFVVNVYPIVNGRVVFGGQEVRGGKG
jgi:hypothetical protein